MNEELKTLYQQLCSSYHAIDHFRSALLGFLPLASGAGVFLLLNGVVSDPSRLSWARQFLLPIGLFGFLITLGLFAFEVYGIRKCHALIQLGIKLEGQMGIQGQFASRPREILFIINEPFASGIIYSTVMAGWIFLSLILRAPVAAWWLAALVFLLFFGLSVAYNLYLIHLRSTEGKTNDPAVLNLGTE